MEPRNNASDPDVRHFVYRVFAETSRPPTTLECAEHFDIPVAHVEGAYERLANAHHIALAPGSHSIWMAHPFLPGLAGHGNRRIISAGGCRGGAWRKAMRCRSRRAGIWPGNGMPAASSATGSGRDRPRLNSCSISLV